VVRCRAWSEESADSYLALGRVDDAVRTISDAVGALIGELAPGQPIDHITVTFTKDRQQDISTGRLVDRIYGVFGYEWRAKGRSACTSRPGSVQQLTSAAANPPLRDRIHSRCLNGGADDPDPGRPEHGIERPREAGVPVMQDELRSCPGIPQVHEQVPSLLDNPGLDRVRGAQDPDAPVAVLDHRKDVHLRAIEQVSGEKVQRQDPPCLGPQELRPTHRFDMPAPVTTPGHAVPGRPVTGFRWYRFPMEAVIDQAGRVVLPKPIRDALGLLPGTKVDITPYGAGAQLLPAGRTARLVEEDGVLVADAETAVDDDMVFALIDAGRK
jgi:AbrB family looped-hinge helix DNA binding protein